MDALDYQLLRVGVILSNTRQSCIGERTYPDSQVLHRRGTDVFDEERVRQLSSSEKLQNFEFLQAMKMHPDFIAELGSPFYAQPLQSVLD